MSEHIHECDQWRRDEWCDAPCVCACGAVLRMGPTFTQDGRWAWQRPDGTWDLRPLEPA